MEIRNKVYGIIYSILIIASVSSCQQSIKPPAEEASPVLPGSGVTTPVTLPSNSKRATIPVRVKNNGDFNGRSNIHFLPPVTKPAYTPASSFTIYNTEQGLALSSITCSAKDRYGNLWFGTNGGGVSRYDGKSFITFTPAQGLAEYSVASILEDKSGNLWFGTGEGGVSRYDGNSFVTFTTAQGLANNTVKCMLEDKDGNLWFGTEGGGVSCYNPAAGGSGADHRFTNFRSSQGLADNYVTSIIEDRQGNLWFGTYGGGVSRYASPGKDGNGKIFTTFDATQGLANNFVSCIAEDNNGNLWFGTDGGGVSRYDPGMDQCKGKSASTRHFTTYTTVQGLANNKVMCILKDKQGNLWFGSDDGGLTCYDGKTFTILGPEQGLDHNRVVTITEDNSGNLWLGTNGCGVSRYDGSSFSSFATAQGLANDNIRFITEDGQGNLWLASKGGGVSRYDGKSFTVFTTAQGLAHNLVWCIAGDKDGNLWFGTGGGGASRYNPSGGGLGGKSFTTFNAASGLAFDDVRCIFKEKNGNLWFGTYGGGVSCYDGKTFSTYTTDQGLANNKVLSIEEDNTGNLWFATAGGGVSRFDKKTFTTYSTSQGLAHNIVRCIAKDRSGNLWFGTYGGGISRYDGNSFATYSTAQGLADDVVYDIVEDDRGELWIGTNLGFSGLKFEEPGTGDKKPAIVGAGMIKAGNSELKKYTPVWEIYNNKTGYPVRDLNTNAMHITRQGVIWGGCGDDKVIRFDPAAIHKNPAPLSLFIQAVKINEENICWHLLQDKSKVTGKNEKVMRARDYYHGNVKIAVDSSGIIPEQDNSLMAIINEEITVFGRTLSGTERKNLCKKFGDLTFSGIARFYPLPENLVLPYQHNHITFEFSAIEPARPFMVQYQYILEGYNDKWSPVTNRSSATFGNIFEGTYTFKLKACSPNGVWSEPVMFTFKVLPPWYRTWWMYCIYVAVFLLTIWSFIKWRERKLEKEKEVLEEKVKIRTAQLLQANEEIMAQRDNLESLNMELNNKNEEIETQRDEIAAQRDLVTDQKEKIEAIHHELTDSIRYAKRIQNAVLPGKDLADQLFKEYFILFKPRDIVSGDFYWFSIRKNWLLAAVADCTGHGVPGAFMSMLGVTFLNEIVVREDINQAGAVLDEMRDYIIKSLQQRGIEGEQKDGMDMAFVAIDLLTRMEPSGKEVYTLQYAGANNPLYITKKVSPLEEVKPLEEIKADKMPIAIHENLAGFTSHAIEVRSGDTIYLATDGYEDQFGGPVRGGKKFLVKKFRALLSANSHLPMQEQKKILDETIEQWRMGYSEKFEQTDDITVVGIKL